MTVATWLQTDYTTSSATAWKTAIDGDFAVASWLVDAFAVHERPTPNMKVNVDAGFVFTGTTLTTVAAQTSATIVAPVANPRIDFVVADRYTGTIQVVTGTEAASPVPPAIPSGKVPLATIALATSTTAITNSLITDQRALSAFGRGTAGDLNVGTGLRNDGNNNLQAASASSVVSSNQVLAAANHKTKYKNTSAINYTLPAISGVWVGYEVEIFAKGGAGTLIPDSSDAVSTLSAGASYTVPTGSCVTVFASAAHQWDIRGDTESGVTAGAYTLASVTVDKFGRVTAASNGSAASGNFVKIGSGSLTAASTKTLSGISAGTYKLILTDLTWGSGTTNSVTMTVSTDNGSTFLSSGYGWVYQYVNNVSGATANNNSAGSITLTPAILDTTHPNTIEISLWSMATAGAFHMGWSGDIANSSGLSAWLKGSARNAANVNAIKIAFSGAGLATGTYALYQLT